MPRILRDDDLAPLIDMKAAIAAVERAMRAKAQGALVAPPRHLVSFPGFGALAFTIGGVTGANPLAGFRVYETFPGGNPDRSQIVAVWNPSDGSLRGIVLGQRLGDLRTGAIGGLAIRHMARAEAETIGLIGSGAQARTQLEAAAAVRAIRSVRVYSRAEENRRRFAGEMARRLELPIDPVASARDAVTGADIVICATGSASPVIEAAWLRPGAHVHTLGAKTRDRHELGLDVAERAAIIATDSPDQARAYGAPFILEDTPAITRLADLADIVTGRKVGRPAEDAITLFYSVGLAGTEVLVAAAALEQAERLEAQG